MVQINEADTIPHLIRKKAELLAMLEAKEDVLLVLEGEIHSRQEKYGAQLQLAKQATRVRTRKSTNPALCPIVEENFRGSPRSSASQPGINRVSTWPESTQPVRLADSIAGLTTREEATAGAWDEKVDSEYNITVKEFKDILHSAVAAASSCDELCEEHRDTRQATE
eukprot:GEMP01073802.1.p1 GENE.GEMP01073802.1~~GEMP01073802.1.p1  ORF type:complete len:167 (+),score=34.61 GEMP01073802.1:93-593(+)